MRADDVMTGILYTNSSDPMDRVRVCQTQLPVPWISDFERLLGLGTELPSPDSMDDEEIGAKLWELVGRLAGIGTYLINTNHLSDAELYHELWNEVLHEETPDSNGDLADGCWVVDMVGRGEVEDVRTWLRYYASEREREAWLAEFPEESQILHEDPPFDRDRYLPAPVYCDGGRNACSLERRVDVDGPSS